MSSTYIKQCQAIITDYEKAGGAWPAKRSELVEWALSNKRWSPSREDIRRMCGEALVEAMRQDSFRDESGREVRAKVSARTTRDGEQGVFWADLRKATANNPDFVRVHVAQTRRGVAGDLHRLTNVVRYFNTQHDDPNQIILSLDFTKDVRELDVPQQPKERAVTVPSASEPLPRAGQPRSAVHPTTSAPEPSHPSSHPSDPASPPPRSSPTVH